MKTFKEITNWTKNFLEGPWGVVATCWAAMIFWLAGFEMAAVCVLAISVIVCFLICDNVRLLYGPFLLVPFFSVDVQNKSELIAYAIIFAVVFVSFVYFMIKHRKTKVRKGDLFWGLLIADIAFLLGGIVGHFSIRNFAIILALNIALYLLYFVAINHTKDLIPYLMLCFVVVGTCLAVQHGVMLLRTGNVFESILARKIYEIGAVSINVVALYYPLGVIGGIYLFKKAQKYNYLFLLLSITVYIYASYILPWRNYDKRTCNFGSLHNSYCKIAKQKKPFLNLWLDTSSYNRSCVCHSNNKKSHFRVYLTWV